MPWIGPTLPNWTTLAAGIAGFFRPNPLAFMGRHAPLAADGAAYYSTAPLWETLSELVDFSLLAKSAPRLTVGAAKVRTSEMRYFDSRDMPLTTRHVMASGALPPTFPPIRIDGDLYWDGGIPSNTPSRRSSTTIRGATRSSSRSTSGTPTGPNRKASGRLCTGRRRSSIRAGRSRTLRAMLRTDVSGLDVTCASLEAVGAWNRTVEHFLSPDKATPTSLAEALGADPDFALAWCAKGLFTMLLARAELRPRRRAPGRRFRF